MYLSLGNVLHETSSLETTVNSCISIGNKQYEANRASSIASYMLRRNMRWPQYIVCALSCVCGTKRRDCGVFDLKLHHWGTTTGKSVIYRSTQKTWGFQMRWAISLHSTDFWYFDIKNWKIENWLLRSPPTKSVWVGCWSTLYTPFESPFSFLSNDIWHVMVTATAPELWPAAWGTEFWPFFSNLRDYVVVARP